MRQLIAIYRTYEENNDRYIRFFKSTNKVRAEVYSVKPFKKLNVYRERVCRDANTFLQLNGEKLMLDLMGIKSYFKVPFERKNGKIVLFGIDKQRRVIYTNEDYEEWKKGMIEDGETDEDMLDYERYSEYCEITLEDERCNLDIAVDGYIIAFADLGFWNGRRNGLAMIGDNVKDILQKSYGCDYYTFYCDPHNVKFDGHHHDGSHYIMFRVARSKEHAEHLMFRMKTQGLTEEEFRRVTKSLRPYVANVYGW